MNLGRCEDRAFLVRWHEASLGSRNEAESCGPTVIVHHLLLRFIMGDALFTGISFARVYEENVSEVSRRLPPVVSSMYVKHKIEQMWLLIR